jgi:hypothetical protein
VKTVLSILVIIGLLVLVGFFWKDVIPAGADIFSVFIGAVFAWYAFWALVDIVFG